MHVIDVRNVNHAYSAGMMLLADKGQTRDSRAGPVLVMNEPVTTVYRKPNERVLFNWERDANPFFHFMEGLWMISGRNDVAWISQFNSNMASFSDNGVTFHGAYGHRWRNYFVKFEDDGAYEPFDQLAEIAHLIQKNREDRRIVLQMWDPCADLGRDGKDFPCNVTILFRVNNYGYLDMTVFNRSNDIIWGAYGANAVHMSMLHELMSGWTSVPLGSYYQISNNFHAYKDIFTQKLENVEVNDLYMDHVVSAMPMLGDAITPWFQDLVIFMEEGPVVGFQTRFFKRVVTPMWVAWKCYKDTDNPARYDNAAEALQNCVASDWKLACMDWLDRRKQNVSA